MVEAASRGAGGIRQLISAICPPDFRMLEVGEEEEASTPVRASASQQQLCRGARRALAAAQLAEAGAGLTGMPVLLVAERRYAEEAAADVGVGPAGARSGTAASAGKRQVVLKSVMSIRDLIADVVAPYAPLSVPGPQAVAALNHLKRLAPYADAVAALNHLKRLAPRAKDRPQRRKVVELSNLLITSLHSHVSALAVKDTCLALNAVADAAKASISLHETPKQRASPAQSSAAAVLVALRKRLQEHLSRAPLRFSGRLLGIALNALAKVRDLDRMDEEEELLLFDLAERMVLVKGVGNPDVLDLVTMSHVAHAYTPLIRHAAPPPGVDVHKGLPDLVPDSYSEFDVKWLPEGSEDSSGSSDEGQAQLEELEQWATEQHAYAAGDDDNWRQFGRYGRLVEFIAAEVRRLDAAGLQAQGLAHLVELLGKSGKLRQDKAVYARCRELILATDPLLFSEVPFALGLLLDGLRHAGVADEEVLRHLAAAADSLSPRLITDEIILGLLEAFEALDNLQTETRILRAAASGVARPLDELYRNTDAGRERPMWLRRVMASLKLTAAAMPLNKWTPATLSRFAWCAHRSTREDPGVLLPGEEREEEDTDNADSEFAAYVSRALINTDPAALDGATAAALLAYHARAQHAAGAEQARLDALVLAFIAEALVRHVGSEVVSLTDWVAILQSVTLLHRPPQPPHSSAAAAGDAEGLASHAEGSAAAEGELLLVNQLFETAGKRVLAMNEKDKEALSVPQSLALVDAFVRCAPAQAGVLEALVRRIVADGADGAGKVAGSPALVGRISSILPLLYSTPGQEASAGALLLHLSAALSQVPPPPKGAIDSDLIAKMAGDMRVLPPSPARRTVFERISMLCRTRAPNLFSRASARATLQAFASLDMEEDAVFVHLARIARGRAALPSTDKAVDARPDAFGITPGKRGLF